MGIEFEELSNRIINAAIKVHKKLGPGFLESIYEKAMVIQLEKDGMKAQTQKEIKIYYDGQEIGVHRLNIMVNGEIVVELKAVKELNDSHVAQLLSYLKASGLRVGLLFNFAKPTLEIKRVVN